MSLTPQQLCPLVAQNQRLLAASADLSALPCSPHPHPPKALVLCTGDTPVQACPQGRHGG